MNASHSASDIRDRLLDAAGLSLDRLPMLHVIFDRMATHCADHLRHLAASPMYYSLSSIESGRIGDVLEMYEANAIAGVFHAPEWDSHVLVGFDRDFVFTMVEVLLGSDGSEPPVDEERGFSNIEPEAGFMVVYAAKHGETALDGDSANSPFATVLARVIKEPKIEVRKLFDIVRDDVWKATNRTQQPFTYGSLPGREDFYFVAGK